MYRKLFLLKIFLIFSLLSFAQQKVIISGIVSDASTGEALDGAVVYTEDKSVFVQSNASGYYSISLAAGDWKLFCSYAGYQVASVEVSLRGRAEKLDFDLIVDAKELEAAKVLSHSNREMLKIPQMGTQYVDADIVRKVPALMGEADIIRVIQMLPGVQAPSEGSTGFSVRGGGVDQNLILMDGAPIYVSGHFLGFFSMFNDDVVKSAQIYKGDFPARLGGRTSSVLEINTEDGNMSEWGGQFSIGLIASKINLNGPIVKDKLSLQLSARRSYADAFFPLLKNRIPERTRIFFYDVNAKLNYIINDRNRISASAFSSRDLFGLAVQDMGVNLMTFDYRNNTQSIRWSNITSERINSNTTLYNSIFTSLLDADVDASAFTWNTKIIETGIKQNFTWDINASNTMAFGAQIANYNISPSETRPTGESIISDVVSPGTYAASPAIFVQNESKLGPLTVRYGIRTALFSTYGETDQFYFDSDTHELSDERHFSKGEVITSYAGLDPRISASFMLSEDSSLKVAYSRARQYIQQAIISAYGSVSDIWFTASPNVKPQISDQVSFGFNHNFMEDSFEFTLEGFYKNNKNTLDFKDNPGLIIGDKYREGLLRFGKSWSYGIETMLKYEYEKFSGWINYTWSRAMYNIPEINNGKPYRSPVNHEHSVNFIANYEINKRLSASASWVFYSGAPTTFPVGRFEYEGTYVPIYSERNEDSMPDYHRLDLSVNYKTRQRVINKKWSGEWNFSLYNAYARHNAWSIASTFNYVEGVGETQLTYLFSAVPSISYNIIF